MMRVRRFVALTGAGCSTESGIPDYRGPETARRARNPIRFKDFIHDRRGQQRYWARSFRGWPRIADASPNRGHLALAALERSGHLLGVITQNVDRLHARARSRQVIELHGALADVRCLNCGALEPRQALQERLASMNPNFDAAHKGFAPDGDADVQDTENFLVADCLRCGGALKPDVVFFGEAVPQERVAAARALVEQADGLLVVGTSLTVYSGFRFVRQAHRAGQPIAVLNIGPTRGDALADLKVEGSSGPTLATLFRELAGDGQSTS